MILSLQSLPSALCYQKKYTSPLTHTTKEITISLVKSQISYCCQLWWPQLIKHIQSLERIQRKATKYILNNYSNNYKSRLLELRTLPLMYWLEIQDIMLLIRNLKDTSDANDLHKYIKFINKRTRANGVKLEHKFVRLTTTRNFFFIRIVRLWNALPRGVFWSHR